MTDRHNSASHASSHELHLSKTSSSSAVSSFAASKTKTETRSTSTSDLYTVYTIKTTLFFTPLETSSETHATASSSSTSPPHPTTGTAGAVISNGDGSHTKLLVGVFVPIVLFGVACSAGWWIIYRRRRRRQEGHRSTNRWCEDDASPQVYYHRLGHQGEREWDGGERGSEVLDQSAGGSREGRSCTFVPGEAQIEEEAYAMFTLRSTSLVLDHNATASQNRRSSREEADVDVSASGKVQRHPTWAKSEDDSATTPQNLGTRFSPSADDSFGFTPMTASGASLSSTERGGLECIAPQEFPFVTKRHAALRSAMEYWG